MASSPELIHPVPVEEVAEWERTMATAFLGDPHGPAAARHIEMMRRSWEPQRAWGMRAAGRLVATLRTHDRLLSVPGLGTQAGEIRVDALTNVAVSATHRRQGLMRSLLERSLRAARDRGDPLSILIAAEWPIYGRFGYAPATDGANYSLRVARPGSTVRGDVSRVRQVERDEFGEVAPAVFAAAKRRRPGQIDRDADWWNRVLGLKGYEPSDTLPHNWLLHEGDDGPDGLVAWKATDDGGLIPPLATLDVWDLTTASDAAYRDLWAYLSGIDGVDEIRVSDRPVDEPVRWLLADGRTLVMTRQVDFLWLRLLDVPAALRARRYSAPGELVLEVADPHGDGFAAGRYLLRADGDEVQCERTDRRPDLEITQPALASMYLGGHRLGELLPAGAARAYTSTAFAQLDLMFSTPLAPWNATWF